MSLFTRSRHSRLAFSAAAIAMTSALLPATAGAADFCDRGPAHWFLETEVHVLAGATGVAQNYMSSFAEIRDLNSSMAAAWGIGARAEFGLREFLALGTQLNLIQSNYRLDLAVSDEASTSVSNIFLRNRAYYVQIPVYLSVRFNASDNVRWNVDAGAYYAYGIAGSQHQSMFTAMINDLGQLVSHTVEQKPDYFNNPETFLNRFHRGDIGAYISTGLTFNRRLRLGIAAWLGCKNVSYTHGIVNPRIHNMSIFGTIGICL